MNFKQYSRVKLLSDNYSSEGASEGAIGIIIEIYGDGPFEYEIDFSNPETGETVAQIVVSGEEIEYAE